MNFDDWMYQVDGVLIREGHGKTRLDFDFRSAYDANEAAADAAYRAIQEWEKAREDEVH